MSGRASLRANRGGPLESEGPVCVEACRRLWSIVLRDGIDAALTGADAVAEGSVNRKKRSPIPDISWLGGKDFDQVCDLAGLDGDAVAEAVRPMIENKALRGKFKSEQVIAGQRRAQGTEVAL